MKKINIYIYILLLSISSSTTCMMYILQTVTQKLFKKNEEVEEKKENKETKDTNSLQKNNILALSPKIPKVFDDITLDKDSLTAISKGFGAAAAVALLAYYYKNDLLNIKKDIDSQITEHKNILVENEKKMTDKKKLSDIAGKDYEKFRLITPKELEAIFLPHNLDLINDFYQVGCCLCPDEIEEYRTYEPWEEIHKLESIKLVPNRNKIYKAYWIKPDNIFEDQVLYFEDTLLTIACRAGNFEVCKWLLENGADPNLHGRKKDRQYTEGDVPLFACLNQVIDIHEWNRKKDEEFFREQHEKLKPYLELLLQYGANPNVYSPLQKTCYFYTNPAKGKLSLMNNIARHFCCDYCDKYHEKGYAKNHREHSVVVLNHSANCNNARLLLRHGAIPICKPSCDAKFTKFWRTFLLEGFDPNQKNFSLLCFIIHEIMKRGNGIEEGFGFLKLLLAYGHETKKLLSDNINIPIGEILGTTYNDDQLQLLSDIFNECKVFIQEEYDFRKSYLENPEQLFLKLAKRCKRPDLWIERISDEMEIPLEKQHEIMREICFKSLTLLHNTFKGQKNELLHKFWYRKEELIYDVLKTIQYMLDNLHKKGILIFDKGIKRMITKIIFYGLQKLYEKNDEYKMEVLPFIEYCSKNPHYVNWTQKKEGKNIFHLLAYGIDNKLLKTIIKNLQEQDSLSLQHALKQPLTSSRFDKETHTTPLYIATKESCDDFKCIKTRKLLAEAEYTQYRQTYHHNPYIGHYFHADNIAGSLLKNY